MRIGEVAKRTGLSRDTIRFYERRGLLPPPERTHTNYRLYDGEHVRVLLFIKQARGVGLSLSQIRQLIELKRRGRQPCPAVKRLLEHRIEEIDRTITALRVFRQQLNELLGEFAAPTGDSQPEGAVCAVLERFDTKGHLAFRNEASGRVLDPSR